MSLVRMVVGIPVLVFSVLLAWIAYTEYKEFRYKSPAASPEARFNIAHRKCLIAEAAEGAASENDQVMIVAATLRVARKRNIDPCWLFTRYTLMRAPSDERKQASLRDPDFVIGKGSWFAAAESRIALATKVVDRILGGDNSFARGESVDLELARHRMLGCVEKYIRVWPINTARTDAKKMREEMGESITTPAGTVFFCPK